MNKAKYKLVDLFSGIGGFSAGFHQNNFETVYYSEINNQARQAFSNLYGKNIPFNTDITKLKATEIPLSDVWTFGSPCQNISVAGKGEGLSGSKSSMFFEVVRLLNELEFYKRPKIILMENVKRLKTINQGKDLTTVLTLLTQAGYRMQYQIINSKLLVPQNRERIYLLGIRKDLTKINDLLPIKISQKDVKLRDVLEVENEVPEKYWLTLEQTKYFFNQYHTEINQEIKKENNINIVGLLKNSAYKSTYRVYSIDGISSTLNTMQEGNRQPKIVLPVQVPAKKTCRSNGRRFKTNDESAFTITTVDRHGVILIDKQYFAVRKLTPKECLRLQGFNDETFNKNKALSDSALYRLAGNAVSVPIINELAKRIKAKLDRL